jgi:hypothetical protein
MSRAFCVSGREMDTEEVKLLKKNARMSLKIAVRLKKFTGDPGTTLDVLQGAVNILLGPGYTIVNDDKSAEK